MSLQVLADLDLSEYPLSEKVLTELGAQMPFLLKSTLSAPGPPLEVRLPDLESILRRAQAMQDDPESDLWVTNAVRSYIVLSIEFLKLQRQLEQTGRYLLSTEREAQERVYHNKDVFGAYYLYGLLLSEVLWPNHYQLNASYREEFLPQLKDASRVLEVGVGTGYHLYHLVKAHPGVEYQGVDLSDYAIEFAGKFAFGREGRKASANFRNQNVMEGLDVADNHYDALVFGEVLEHVEEPDRLLKELARVAKPGAPMFMTTVIFAANIDHIYLFEKADDIRRMVTSCGWAIDLEWILPIYPQDSPEMEKRPMNYGSVLRKA